MGLREDIAPYIDEDGLVLENRNSGDGPETGNGIRNLCTLVIIQHLRRELTKRDVDAFVKIIRSCEVKIREGLTIPGLYHRGPRKTEELVDHDDYRALACASYLIGVTFAKEIFWYGSEERWSFNNLPPYNWTLRSWFARQPDFVPLIRHCASRNVGFLGNAILALAFALGRVESDPGAAGLTWLMAKALKGRVAILDAAIEYWEKRVRSRWGTVSVIMGEYYGRSHPLASYCPD